MIVFFHGLPVKVVKISNLFDKSGPVIQNLQSLHNKKDLFGTAVACISKSTVILTGGSI